MKTRSVDEHGNVADVMSARLKEPISAERKFDDVVQAAQAAAVLVLVY